MEEKEERKMTRKRAKEFRKEFVEDYGYVEVDPKRSMRRCCAEAFDGFDALTHEAWLMQCPKGMDPQRLLGKRIKLPGRRYVGDLQVRASNYQTPLDEAVGYVNSKGKYALCKMPITGYVVVSKRLNTIKPVEEEEPDSEFPAAPGPPKLNLPVRHPFFGRDYKKRVELPEPIAKALKKADEKSAKTNEKLKRTANYYAIKSKLLRTTQTLEEKEHEVRQSVLTGIRPKFMSLTTPLSMLLDDEIKEETEETNLVKIKEEPTTPKKQKKRKSKGEIPVNGRHNLEASLVAIKEEEPESESQPKKHKKQKKNKSNEEILVNGTSSLQDSVVIIKEEEPDFESQAKKHKKQKKNKSQEENPLNGTLQDTLVDIEEEPKSKTASEKEKKHKKRKSNGENPDLQDSLVIIKEESESESQTEKRKKRKRTGVENVSIDEIIEVKQEEEEAVPQKKKKKVKKDT